MKQISKALLLTLLTDPEILDVIAGDNYDFVLAIKGEKNADTFEYCLTTGNAQFSHVIKSESVASAIAVALKFGNKVEIATLPNKPDYFSIRGLNETLGAWLQPRFYNATPTRAVPATTKLKPYKRRTSRDESAGDLT